MGKKSILEKCYLLIFVNLVKELAELFGGLHFKRFVQKEYTENTNETS